MPDDLQLVCVPTRPATPVERAQLAAVHAFWKASWGAALADLEVAAPLFADPLLLHDEAVCLTLGGRPVGLMCLTEVDPSCSVRGDSTLLRGWTPELRARVPRRGHDRVHAVGQVTLAPELRGLRIDDQPVKDLLFAGTVLRSFERGTSAIIGTTRRMRGMTEMIRRFGGTTLAEVLVHGEASDAVFLDRARLEATRPDWHTPRVTALWSAFRATRPRGLALLAS